MRITLKLVGINKVFTSVLQQKSSQALFDINLSIHEGEIVCLLGPSGSGKTPLLRIIAGIETESSGYIELEGRDIRETTASERAMGFVFQNVDAIYPHLTVYGNIAFPLELRIRKHRPDEVRAHVKDILGKVDLVDKAQ